MLGKRGQPVDWNRIVTTLTLCAVFASCQTSAQEARSLAGTWRFRADLENKGLTERCFEQVPSQKIDLPGSMQENGYGDDVTVETAWTGQIVDQSWFTAEKYEPYRQPDNIKVPFWLTPVKHYVGPAWYQKEIHIPGKWNAKRIVLFLERCHWETQVWVDGRSVGTNNSLSAPHEYDLGVLGKGRHILTICVDNTVKVGVGVNAHSVSDHTQTNWNGIIGDIELRAYDDVRIDDVQVYPDVEHREAKVRVTIVNPSGQRKAGILTLQATGFNSNRKHKVAETSVLFATADANPTVEVDYAMGDDVLLWDEFSPNLYRLAISIKGRDFRDERTVVFGMREFTTQGTQFAVNGRKTFLRGTLECCIFPLTGYPPMEVKAWRKVLAAVKAHGLNHLRFHSWCPPEAAFLAADEMGVMYHIECAAWTNSGPTLGDGAPIDEWIYAESDRILKAYGNHPSFCMLAYGNEPAGDHQKEYLGKLVEHWKGKDPRRVYTSGAGWPILPENDYHSTPGPRGHQWGAGLASRFNAEDLTTDFDYADFVTDYPVPIVSHEIGQWCVYPNFDEIKKYKGVLKAKNFEIFRDSLAAHGMLDQARDFLIASGRLQTILYKEEIEAALRTPGFGGFQLLDLHDFPGQGTALVGVLDPFWESKGYVKPAEYHRFCSETVPLLRMPKCIWTDHETFEGQVQVAHFGPAPIQSAVVRWQVQCADGRPMVCGRFPAQDILLGSDNRIGVIQLDLSQAQAPTKLVIAVEIEGTGYGNSWDVWVYPGRIDPPAARNVLIVEHLDINALRALREGRNVLLMPHPENVASDVPAGFTTIFWNTQWTNGQPPHTLGILCDPKHPALASFPTEFHSNWQWQDLIRNSKAMVLDTFPAKLKPIVQVIDDWNRNRKLGLVFEGAVGDGKLLVCSIDLRTDLEKRPAARQMLRSLLDYMDSAAFQPELTLQVETLDGLLKKQSWQ
ncbi:MAG TPA: hypothetical protein PLU87_07485 [Sedimentisphaerales bacterium]|nr:hypothetical protein [Sedimentisphaerales bacterium]HRS10689.1 hypothetical protein [Sedimentisphaerales bacterium]HRV47394.1 hypothetical protein [Sedimentisphaerales bacterium]